MHTQASVGKKKKSLRTVSSAKQILKIRILQLEMNSRGGRAKTSCAFSGDISRLQLQIFFFFRLNDPFSAVKCTVSS